MSGCGRTIPPMTVLALSLAVALCASPNESTIRVSPGRQEVLKVPGIVRVALGDEAVADVRVTGGNELLISGRQRGRTSLLLWTRGASKPVSRTIVVDDGKTDELSKMVHELVNPSLRVETFSDKVVIDGSVDSMHELRRLHTLVGDDPNVKLLVRLNPAVIPYIAAQINDAFQRNGLMNARANVVGSKIVLEGSVSDSSERQKAQNIADAYYGTI